MEENINIKVEKKKKSIVPVLFVIIVVLLVVLGILLYDRIDTNDEGTISNEQGNKQENVELNVNNEENLNNEENVVNTENEVQENQNVQNNEANNAVAKAYEKIGDEYWVSKKTSDKYNSFTINNGSIEYSNGNVKNYKINFEYGKVKYLDKYINGGVLGALILITEENDAYKIRFNGGLDLGGEPDQSKFVITKIELGEKIIDFTITGGDAVVPYSGPYYLTESGKLLTEDGTSYEEINRNHIVRIGSLGKSVYVNKDNTLEILRVSGTNEYITIVDENGKKIRAKSVFYESSERWYGTTQEHFYAVDENDILLHFYEGSLMVADEYYDSEGKIKVISINYDQNASKIEISFTDGKSITIEKVYGYKELDYKKVD